MHQTLKRSAALATVVVVLSSLFFLLKDADAGNRSINVSATIAASGQSRHMNCA